VLEAPVTDGLALLKLIPGSVGEMCTPATIDVVTRGKFSKVTLADFNLDKVKKLAQELCLNPD